MGEGNQFSMFADRLAELRRRELELGCDSLAEIRRTEAELAVLLGEVFGSEDEKAAAWLVQPLLAWNASPVELMAAGSRGEVCSMLASIVRGLCA